MKQVQSNLGTYSRSVCEGTRMLDDVLTCNK